MNQQYTTDTDTGQPAGPRTQRIADYQPGRLLVGNRLLIIKATAIDTSLLTVFQFLAVTGTPSSFFALDVSFEPPLQGYRLVGDWYERMAPDAEGALCSEVLGLALHLDGARLVLTDTFSAERLLTPREVRASVREFQAEHEALDAATERLRAELDVGVDVRLIR